MRSKGGVKAHVKARAKIAVSAAGKASVNAGRGELSPGGVGEKVEVALRRTHCGFVGQPEALAAGRTVGQDLLRRAARATSRIDRPLVMAAGRTVGPRHQPTPWHQLPKAPDRSARVLSQEDRPIGT